MQTVRLDCHMSVRRRRYTKIPTPRTCREPYGWARYIHHRMCSLQIECILCKLHWTLTCIWLGKYETLWQCEDACISLPSGPSAGVVKGDEVCVAFTYVAHSTKKNALNGQCYGRVTDVTTMLTVASVPFPRTDFLGPAGMDGVTSGTPT
jgi:hypothetical protein